MNIKKVFILLAIPVFLFTFNTPRVSAQDNSALILQLQQEIQSLMRQLITLLQQQIISQAQVQTPVQIQAQNNSKTAVLTVNATGVTAYVSINNGAQFAYTAPIILNNGDAYLVVASISNNGNSTSKCSGTASSGGNYVCNINMNNY